MFAAKRSNILVASLATLAAIGCQQSPYELAPVRGKVTIDGQPVFNAKVMFAPVEAGGNPNPGKPAFGILRNDGSFVLTTYETDDGAVVGEHWVTIISLEKGTGSSGNTTRLSPKRFTKLAVPHRMPVKPGIENVMEISLTSDDVKKYGVLVSD